MNGRRVAQLLRELADEFDCDDAVVPPPAESKPRAKRRRTAPSNVTDIDRAYAASVLGQKGFRKVDP